MSEATPSAETPYSACPGACPFAIRTENVESLTREIRSACFVLNRRASKVVFNLAEMSLGWPRRLLGQGRALQRRHAAPKLKMGEVTTMRNEKEEAAVYGDPDQSSGVDVNR